MGFTVLEIVQSALYDTGNTPPTSLITATAFSLKMKNILYSQTRQLRNLRVFPQQKKKYTFDLVSGQSSYQLPRDFYAACMDTQWDDDRKLRLLGPLSDGDFTARTKGLITTSNFVGYRIFGPDTNPNSSASGQFEVTPTPTSSGETLSFEYISSNMFLPPYWAPSTAYVIGDYVSSSGNIYLCDTNGTSSSTSPSATTANITDGTTRWDYQSAAYERIVTNSDLCLFDDDIMIAGVKWRYLRSSKLEFQEEYEQYVALLKTAQTRHVGSFVGSMCGPTNRRRYSVTSGGWTF